MTALLGAAGRAFLKDFAAALLVLGAGIWAAPDLQNALLIAVTAIVGATRAGLKAITVFVPQLTFERLLADRAGFLGNYAYVFDALVQSAIAALIALGVGLADYIIAGAPTLDGVKLIVTTGLVALVSGLWTVLQGLFTPGTHPAPTSGLSKSTDSQPALKAP